MNRAKPSLLITGGAGFIGSHICELYEDLYDITVIDDFSTGKRINIMNRNVRIVEMDITNHAEVDSYLEENGFDNVVHLAALVSVQECEHNPEKSHRINTTATINLIDAASRHKAGKFIFASSAAVYGNNTNIPLGENEKSNPISNYGYHKHLAENYLLQQTRLNRINGCILRFFNVYGPRQDPSSPYSGVMSIFMNKFLTEDEPELTVYGDGRQSRDFVYVRDVARIINHCLNNDSSTGEIFNVGRGERTSLIELIERMSRLARKNVGINFKNPRPGDIIHSCSDNKKSLASGFQYQFDLDKGLEDIFEYYGNCRARVDYGENNAHACLV